MMEDITIRHRHSGATLFTARVDTRAGGHGIKLREALKQAVRADVDLAGADMTGANLDGYNGYLWLPGADLSHASFVKCDLHRANYEGATLTGAAFFNGCLRKCSFTEADLRGSYWDNASVDRGYFDGADFSGAGFRNASFFEVHMENVKFRGADFRPENMEGDFRGADFAGARFAPQSFGGELDGIKLEGAILDARFKAEFWSELVHNHPHVAGLRETLAKGAVWFPSPDGRGSSLWRTWRIVRQDATWGYPLRPDEKEACDGLFQFLSPGDKPDSATAGGFVLRLLIEWIDEYRQLTGRLA